MAPPVHTVHHFKQPIQKLHTNSKELSLKGVRETPKRKGEEGEGTVVENGREKFGFWEWEEGKREKMKKK